MVFTCAGTRKTCPWTRLTYLRLWTLTKVCFSHRTLDFMFALRFPQEKSDLKMINNDFMRKARFGKSE